MPVLLSLNTLLEFADSVSEERIESFNEDPMKKISRKKEGESNAHQSVLVEEVLAYLAPRRGERVLDATAGAGGHAQAFLEAADISLIALDADPGAVAAVRKRLQPFGAHAKIIEGNFRDLKNILADHNVDSIHKALFDLGWNRAQLESGRGFSFAHDEPLSMSYGAKPASHFDATGILNTWSEEALANVFFGYGGERYARRIAKEVARIRKVETLTTTGQLVALIGRAVPASYRHGRIHFATRTFQALRIAVNDEFGSLEQGLAQAWEILIPGGRVGVISFHSGEDGRVKRQMRTLTSQGGRILTKKPIIASLWETKGNPSARSAKLRVIEKLP